MNKILRRCGRYVKEHKTMGGITLSASCIYSGYQLFGPKIRSEYVRATIAGTTGLVLCELITYPIDTLSTRAKANRINSPNMYIVMKNIMKNESILNLFKGIQAAYLFYPIFTYIYFSMYELLRGKLPKYMGEGISNFLSPMLSEIITIYMYYPVEILITRMQVPTAKLHYKYMDVGIKKMREELRESGLKYIYAGSTPFVLCVILYTTLSFGIYTSTMQLLTRRHLRGRGYQEKGVHVLLSSTLAGGLAGLATNGLESLCVAKQLSPQLSLYKVLNTQPSHLLLRGLLPRVLYSISGCILQFTFIENIYYWFNTNFTDWD